MGYEYEVDTEALFGERFAAFVGFGVPAVDLDRVRARITKMWPDEPGGWTYELSALARDYAGRGEHFLASLVYGVAKFPVLADEARRLAMRKQAEEYVKAAPTFGIPFERLFLDLPYRGAVRSVPVHLFSPAGDTRGAPVLVFSGGIDTWKMDLHQIIVALVAGAGVPVLAFDLPGTGETEGPLDAFADELILGVIGEARRIGNGKVAHFGMSFGSNFSAMSGLSGAVDAAVNLGGPVDVSFAQANIAQLMFGMADIGGNAYGFTAPPTSVQMTEASRPFIRRALLDQSSNAPMLVINGADDVHVPQADTLIFEGRSDTEVHLLAGTGHCAASRLTEVVAMICGWLRAQLAR